MSRSEYIGCVVVLIAVILAQLDPTEMKEMLKRKKEHNEDE